MDTEGRLHLPGFVGQSFEETGLRKKQNETRALFSEPEKDVRQAGRGDAVMEAKLLADKRAELERKLALVGRSK